MMTTGVTDCNREAGWYELQKFKDGLEEDAWFEANKDWVSKIIDNRTDVHNIYEWICSCDWR